MNALLLARDYFTWHYTRALADIFNVWVNYLWFVNHLFSVKDVLFTLFAPWKRLHENPINPLKDMEAFLSSVFVNLIMRIVGMIIRLALIAIALVAWAFVIAVGLVLFPTWIFLPVFMLHGLYSSISSLVIGG